MKNIYTETEITNMTLLAKSFLQRCKNAALKDDNSIDKEEEKTLKKINSATKKFLKELSKIQKQTK